jgi:2'-5' RNA ligase
MKKVPQRRFFVAIDLPAEVRTAAAAVPERFPNIPELTWTPVGQHHLTLRFLGETDEITAATIRGGLEKVSFAPFRVVTAGVGFFPSAREPHIFWLGLNHDERILVFKAQIDQVLAARGFPRENRRFTPHITLARVHNELLPETIEQMRNVHIAGHGFDVDRFHLYASELTPDGAIHSIEQTYHAQA